MDIDPSILGRIMSAEGVGQRLQGDAKLDEVVEGDGASMSAVELDHEEIHGGRLQTIAHHPQRGRQLALVDKARVVAVVTAKCLLPLRHIVPQLGKLLKVDGARVIPIKHDDHLPDRLRIKRSPSSIGKGLSQFIGADLT